MDNFFSNLYFFIGAVFATIAAIGFLIYLRGFISSIGDVFSLLGHEEHVRHGHVRVVWGFNIMLSAFIVWEIFRFIVGWF